MNINFDEALRRTGRIESSRTIYSNIGRTCVQKPFETFLLFFPRFIVPLFNILVAASHAQFLVHYFRNRVQISILNYFTCHCNKLTINIFANFANKSNVP